MSDIKKLSPGDISHLHPKDQDRVGEYTEGKHLLRKSILWFFLTLLVGIVAAAATYRWWSAEAAQGIGLFAGIGGGLIGNWIWSNHIRMKSAERELVVRGYDPSLLEFHHYLNDFLAPKISKAMEDLGVAHNVVDAGGNVVKEIAGKSSRDVAQKQ